MSLLIETIKIYNNRVYNIKYHNSRFNKSRHELFGLNRTTNLRPLIQIPQQLSSGLVKCRVLYNESVESIEFSRYNLKPVNTLQCVYIPKIDYRYKYADRANLDLLYGLRKHADDIIIIHNHKISDSYYGNLAFYDGTHWISPKDCLLPGTARQKLINEKRIKIHQLSTKDINSFSKVTIFNAMIPFKQQIIPIDQVYL